MAGSRVMRLFLVRHGEVAANRSFAFVGRGDDPLTAVGVRQVEALAAFFSDLPIDLVISSPLERCLATARAVIAATGCDLSTDHRLIEQSFGQWDGLTREEIEAGGSLRQEQLRTWQLDPSGCPPGGESLLEVQDRAMELVRDLVARDAGNVMWISHVGPIKAVVCHALGLPLSQIGRFFLDPASISVIDWQRPPVLRVFNAQSQRGWRYARWLASH